MQNALTPEKFLLPHELDELLPRLERHIGERDSVLLRLLMYTGARGCEVLALTPMHLMANDVLVKGAKGSNDRAVPLPVAFMKELREYVELHAIKPTDRIFPITTRRLRAIWARWRRCGKGVKAFRHTVGVKLYGNCRDIKSVQSQLGHKNINNTLVYLDYVDGASKLREKSKGMWKRHG